ncbi:MAG: DNA recombination protein RmuC [Cytophagaceae bacterium]|nr:DNA recombination protein RmuC [Cytophagaceae bacterium]
MEILFLLVGLIIGAGSAWFIAKSKFSNESATGISAEEYHKLDKEKERAETQLALLTSDKEKISKELTEERIKLQEANTRIAKSIEAFKFQEEKIANQQTDFAEKLNRQKEEMENLQKKFTLEFENIANKILDEKTKKFTETNKTNLDIILNPLNEKIKDFGEKVEKIYKSESEERITLKTEIKHLVELNKQISEEANNLASALKGDNKMQGNWGEYILEQILERSGLVKGREYDIQVTSSNEDGDTIKPDVIVNLPDNKHVIVDSKVSLVAYEAFISAANEEDKLRFQKEHVLSVKNHIKTLSEKNYHTSRDFNTPEFILLFIPIESSFSMAIQASEDLFNFAWEKRIVIVSPSTLFATLRTIASIWKQEKQNQHAFEIARQSGNLYDKFVAFVEDLQKIGVSINNSQKLYDEAFNKLKDGKGNLIKRADDIKKLGAKASKSLDPKLVDEANEN